MLTTVRHLSALPYANAVSRKSGLPALGRRLRWLPLALLIAAVAGFLALGAGEARTDSPTFDEPVYVAAGVAAVLHHDLAFNSEHPPLPKALAVLPVLLARPVVPGNGTWSGNDERTYSARFVRAQLRPAPCAGSRSPPGWCRWPRRLVWRSLPTGWRQSCSAPRPGCWQDCCGWPRRWSWASATWTAPMSRSRSR